MERSRPIRVLHVVPSFWPATAYGGPVESVYALCRSEAEAGAEVDVLTTDADGPRRLPLHTGRTRTLAERCRVRYTRRWAGDSVAPGLVLRLPAAMRRCDVVHLTAVYSFPTIPVLLLARLFHRPVVWSPRGSLQRWEGRSRPFLKSVWLRICRMAMPHRTVLHVTAPPEGEASRHEIPGPDVVVVPNGVHVPAADPRERNAGPTRIVFLGRLHPIKAVDHLIDACAICSRRGWADWRLIIAGGGDAEYEASLRARVRENGLDARVSFPGPVRDDRKTALLRSADVVVVPSHSENFSMVVVEALAHGVPVVASTGTPWSDLAARNCGWWVENSPERLADALLESRSADLPSMGARGRQWMSAEFRWDAVAGRLLETYRHLWRPESR